MDRTSPLKEVGLNRETKLFMENLCDTDNFHEVNYISCLNSFKTSIYGHFKNRNTEAAEQFNALLR